jgi:hypothetical protein
MSFFRTMVEKSCFGDGILALVRTFLDVTPRHIRETLILESSGSHKDIKRGLLAMTSHSLELAYAGRPVGWTSADIENMPFGRPTPREDYRRVFPSELFRLVSNRATDHVVGFLRFVGKTPASDVAGMIPAPFEVLASQGATLFETYVDLRLAQVEYRRTRENSTSYGKGADAKRYALDRLGTNAGEMLGYLEVVRDAACSLIALYTGARYTDLTGFKYGCLKRIGGAWFLVGTEIKQEDLKKPLDTDLWPAIPAMRDAIACLELLQEVSQNKFLICSLNTAESGASRPYSINGLTDALDRYVRSVDVTGAWRHVTVSPHRCRHTLAHQLARADVGLVAIAHQMKHLHSALKAVPPQVTLMYGGIADLKMERAVEASAHQYELAKALYDPDSPIAGGGAEEFKVRRKQYFEGMMAAGHDKDAIIRGLARNGVGLSSVGMGLCSGRRDIRLRDGTIEKPPCIGSLQCTPESCHNAIVTKLHKPVWQKVESQNIELAGREDMHHSRTEHLRKVAIAQRVLADLEAD